MCNTFADQENYLYRCTRAILYGPLNFVDMKNAMYVLAFILVISWIIGFFGTGAGDVIHILLVMAIIAVILSDNQAQNSLRKLISKLR